MVDDDRHWIALVKYLERLRVLYCERKRENGEKREGREK